MDKSQQTSGRIVWTIIGVAIVVFIVISVILFILFGSNSPADNTKTSSGSKSQTTQSVATEKEVRDQLSQLNAALKQANFDQKAAQSAINDSKNRVKVGS